MKLTYCAGGNSEFVDIAVRLGWHTGARSDDTIYASHRPIYLLDVHWTEYDWPSHVAKARTERPALTVVPDVLLVTDLPLALAQAEELAAYSDALCIVPKCDVIDRIPRAIGGKTVVLGYSVPSKYGGSPLPVWQYSGWPVHLLGGTPLKQIKCALYMSVVSADGNMANKIAHRGWIFDARGHGNHLDSVEPREGRNRVGMPARAFEVSLRHISALWQSSGFMLEDARCPR